MAKKISELTETTTLAGNDLISLVDRSDTEQSLTGSTRKATIETLLATGWVPVSETWTYASASTFTVPTDLTAKYFKGAKIKMTQTTDKYFYVASSSYSDPNTTVTIVENTSYTIADAAITSPYYSLAEDPRGFPAWKYMSCIATITSEQTNITDASDTKVLFDTTTLDINGDFSSGDNGIEIPLSGYYRTDGVIKYDDINKSGANILFFIKADSTEVTRTTANSSADSYRRTTIQGSKTIYYTAGEIVTMYGRVGIGSNVADIETSTELGVHFEKI